MKTFLTILVTIISSLDARSQQKLLIANQSYYLSEFELAEKQYRAVLQSDPDNTTATYNLGNAVFRQKKFDDAAKIHGQLANRVKDTALKAKAFYNQGVAFSNAKNLEASIEAYKDCLRINPNDTDARDNLQKALSELKQKEQQQKDEQKKKKQEPKMSNKEADQKLKLLQQKEKDLQQKLKDKSRQPGSSQAEDW